MNDATVLFDRRGHLGVITLNRPRQLNALSFAMLEQIDKHVARWRDDPEIAQIALTGAGDRGFCAGGDITEACRAITANRTELFFRFLGLEYRLDVALNEYPKPVISLMDGITFGGGIGLGAHASHRIVTERSRLAMPEVRIGYLPDVGGSLRLAEMPGEVGMHFALTAEAFGAADAIAGGFADHYVPSAQLPELLEALAHERAGEAIVRFAQPAAPAWFLGQREWIDAAYSEPSVGEMLAALDLLAATTPGARAAAASIRQMSPLSLEVTHRLLLDARAEPGLRAAVAREYRVGMHLAEFPDFREGVRARLIDRDNAPRWNPAALSDVSAAEVERLFSTDNTTPLFGEDTEPQAG